MLVLRTVYLNSNVVLEKDLVLSITYGNKYLDSLGAAGA